MQKKQTAKAENQLSVYLDCNIKQHSPINSLTRHKKFTIKRNPKTSVGQKQRSCFSGLNRHSVDIDAEGFLPHPTNCNSLTRQCPSQYESKVGPSLLHYKSSIDDHEVVLHKVRRKKKVEARRHEKIQLKIMKDFHPYVQNVDAVKLVLAHLRPVKGPNESIVQSIGKYKQDNLENVEVVMKNLRFGSFEQAMDEYVKRIGAPRGTNLFIITSKQKNIRTILQSWGWQQNKSRNSTYYHLKWVCNDTSLDYRSIQYGQRFNHFDRNKQLTNKNSLQKNLRRNSVGMIMPQTFDMESYEEQRLFEKEYERQMVFSFVKEFVGEEVREGERGWYEARVRGCREGYGLGVLGRREKQGKEKSNLVESQRGITGKYANLLVQSKTDEAFVYPVYYLLLIIRYCHRIIDEHTGSQTKGIFAYNTRQWSKSRSSIHSYLSNRSLTSLKQSCQLGTPSALLIRQIIKLQLTLSVIFAKQWTGYGSNNMWIVKPVGVSRGTGITIFRDKEKLLESSKNSSKLIQKYIEKPLIFRDVPTVNLAFASHRKFDIRQWVLVTSLRPLEAYKFDKCYVRLCSQKYQLEDFRNTKQHLTNYSQNKLFFTKKEESVLSQQQLKILFGNHQKWKVLQRKITTIILKTLQATCCQMTSHPSCFQMFGFDIIVDESLQPWLLEVNLSPACEQRTEWMSEYIQQMSQGLLRIVLPSLQNNPKNTFYLNHWKRISQIRSKSHIGYTTVIQSLENNEHIIKLITRLQLRWRMMRKYKLQCQNRIKNYKKLLRDRESMEYHNEDIEIPI